MVILLRVFSGNAWWGHVIGCHFWSETTLMIVMTHKTSCEAIKQEELYALHYIRINFLTWFTKVENKFLQLTTSTERTWFYPYARSGKRPYSSGTGRAGVKPFSLGKDGSDKEPYFTLVTNCTFLCHSPQKVLKHLQKLEMFFNFSCILWRFCLVHFINNI